MITTVVKKNSYQDSINLMLLTNRINAIAGVKKCSIMMGTDANKEIYKASGLFTEEVGQAGANDMVIVVDTEKEDIPEIVMKETEMFLKDLSVKKEKQDAKDAKSWDEALALLPEANVALFSIPGEYAAPEIEKALDRNLHVFSFTDNISLEDEVRLKKKAHEKGLLLMGPDCGTGIISGIPIAFTNVVKPGNIGIVGASGTGIQEVTTIIDRLGGGVIHAIGTGGRDLNEKTEAITLTDAVAAMMDFDPADVVVVISKPPAKEVRNKVVRMLQGAKKPVVAIFLGEKPDSYEGNIYFAHTLEETARIAVDLAKGNKVKDNYWLPLEIQEKPVLPENMKVRGLYSGGTLAAEAGMLISEALGLGGLIKKEGYILDENGYIVIDLGDDVYTQGKPHPMIDPEVRIEMIKKYASDPNTGVILFDCMLGYGCHPDMAGALAPVIKETLAKAKEEGRELYYVATVCGTRQDPQDYDKAVQTLKDCGVIVESSNARAVRMAMALKGHNITEADKEWKTYEGEIDPLPPVSAEVTKLFMTKPNIINIGVESFNESIQKYGGHSVQYAWKPAAGGNKEMIGILNELSGIREIEEANQKVVDRLRDAQPFLVNVVPAGEAIPELEEKVLLHAGPPITYKQMTGPMQGSCVGAMLFEGWAKDEADARKQLEQGEVRFIPCHHVHAVGPMGGITSEHMPVLVVENRLDGTKAYCIMNEGIGKVLRFGAFSEEVITRLKWMQNVLGPVLGKALQSIPDGMNLNVIIAKAVTMGDEFHQRNIAASLVFLKEIAPWIVRMEGDEKEKADVIEFLAKTDQFFLNIMMAAAKAMTDCARKIEEGCVVTAMSRNGKDFGIRISGMGDQWFTAPVNTPKGLYFTGFDEKDSNPDIGDSAITETVGVGGMAMIAAPGVTRFVGTGGFDDALRISNEMEQICITHNPNFTIPTWDFKGTVLGIDVRKVVETGITPLINTGIAHKQAGVGQIGAGTVRAPLQCFEKALKAYDEKWRSQQG